MVFGRRNLAYAAVGRGKRSPCGDECLSPQRRNDAVRDGWRRHNSDPAALCFFFMPLLFGLLLFGLLLFGLLLFGLRGGFARSSFPRYFGFPDDPLRFLLDYFHLARGDFGFVGSAGAAVRPTEKVFVPPGFPRSASEVRGDDLP